MLPHPNVSRLHAQIHVGPDRLALVTDLRSANGTFVNGQRVLGPTPLKPGDRLDIGPYLLVYPGDALLPQSREDNVELVCRLRREVIDRTGGGRATRVLLDDVSLVVRPREFVCLLGPSGSGKSSEHVATQGEFLERELEPRLAAAREGKGHVLFVDAAHFVYGTFLCCVWAFTRVFVRAASGRQRFNVLGAWDAVSNTLTAVTNTTVVNTQTMCELLEKVAGEGRVGRVTVVLDNAKYQRNAEVQARAKALGIELLYLPSYSPNLNLIERLWKFIKRRTLYGKYHANFADFKSAIEQTIRDLPGKHRDDLRSLMTHRFQRFQDVSLLAA